MVDTVYQLPIGGPVAQVVLTTVLRYRVHCDYYYYILI